MTSRITRSLALAGFVAALVAFAGGFSSRAADDKKAEPAPKFTAAQVSFYEKEVLPVLTQHCLKCHGADPEKLKGDLSLATRTAVLKGGESGHRSISRSPRTARSSRRFTTAATCPRCRRRARCPTRTSRSSKSG